LGNPSRLAWQLLWLSLICCVFEGALRKWIVGDTAIAARVAYLSKDLALVGILGLGMGPANALTDFGRPYLLLGVALVGIGCLVNAAIEIAPVGAILTILTLLILPATAWIAGHVLPPDSLQRFASWITILALPLAVLGVMQFFSPPGSVLNRYSGSEDDTVVSAAATKIATTGVSNRRTGKMDRVRATGTFSYITGFSDFSVMAVWAGIVTLTLARTAKARWLGYAGLAAAICCTFVTVSRLPVLIALALIAVWTVAGGQFGRKAQAAVAIAALLLTALLVTGKWEAADEIVSSVYERHQSSGRDTLMSRLEYQFVTPLEGALIEAPLGAGLGTQQQAKVMVFKAGEQTSLGPESPWARTVLEVGVVGLLGCLVTYAVIFVPLWAAYRMKIRGEARTVLAVTAVMLLTKALNGFQFDHVSAYFFWATSAAVLALGRGIQR
jgi:hypothetical protein